MRSITRASAAFVVACFPSLALAQNDLGALLDAGATRVSPASFRENVVQRVLVGPAPNGGTQEFIYTPGGIVQGIARSPVGVGGAASNRQELSGEWIIDDVGRVCATVRAFGVGGGGRGPGAVVLPFRCQFWFKLGDTYFVADSDVDRQARVLARKISK